MFFNNHDKSIGKCELMSILKDDKHVSTRTLQDFITEIDKDKSLIITKFIDGKIKHIILTPGLSGFLSSRNPNKIIKKPYEIISSKL